MTDLALNVVGAAALVVLALLLKIVDKSRYAHGTVVMLFTIGLLALALRLSGH